MIPPSEDNTEFTHKDVEISLKEATAVVEDLFDAVSSSSQDEALVKSQ